MFERRIEVIYSNRHLILVPKSSFFVQVYPLVDIPFVDIPLQDLHGLFTKENLKHFPHSSRIVSAEVKDAVSVDLFV